VSISGPFIRRPVATTLLTAAVALAGILAFQYLPVAPVPQVEYPTINIHANLPGASPEVMASAVATPLERQFGRIAGVTEMTSSSELGSTSITLQFDLSRDVNAAARDVQAAINAARGQLPADMPSNPRYWKVNPASAPIMILALTSKTVEKPAIFDAADSILAQKLSQIEGVGQVHVGGSARPAVRVNLNPTVLNSYGISLEDVRAALNSANAISPKGDLHDSDSAWTLTATDQLHHADEYRPLVIAYRNGNPVRLADVATVEDSLEDRRVAGLSNGEDAVLMIIRRQPDANIIDTVDRVKAALPELRASISPAIDVAIATDRTVTIRASVIDVEFSLLISIALVILVVFAFLRNVGATAIPSVSVPLSLLGTFGVMYLLGYSLDNLSLMALTVCTGFVVDDAIVVIENITRYLEKGLTPFQSALRGAREIGFTVFSMSTSLIAVFIPILLMGGIVGRLFREFAVTLAIAICVSLVVSLTTTPMLCAKFLKPQGGRKHGLIYRFSERVFEDILAFYRVTLRTVLKHPQVTLILTILTVALNVYLYVIVPKGFFPQTDTGRLSGFVQASQDISFTAMSEKLRQYVAIVKQDPAVANVVGFTGGGTLNTASMFMSLKPLGERKISSDEVIDRLRPKLARIPGATLYMHSPQDISVGGRGSNSNFDYAIQADNLQELNIWAARMLKKLKTLPELHDVNSDQETAGLETSLVINRDAAARLGVTPAAIDNTLYDAFGQRQVSTMYESLNQYHVVMEVESQYRQGPGALHDIYVRSKNGDLVPLSAVSHYERTNTSLGVNHQGQFPATTLWFNLAQGVALGDAVKAIRAAEAEIGLPANVHGSFQGTAKAFQSSLSTQPLLILTALIAVYIVLGILYESYIHPVTILSTLPSAGVGAILALLLFHTELSIIALIGIVLLIGIVTKNAILMIDFAIETQRKDNLDAKDAIYEACLLRFRPILMTTMAAMLGGLPLALGTGTGAELRRPLGITIVGGLLVSQVLTLYTTPVVYLYLDRLGHWIKRLLGKEPQRTAPNFNPSLGAPEA
jgi:multidrug efflux pump